jgi:hypothetical protein
MQVRFSRIHTQQITKNSVLWYDEWQIHEKLAKVQCVTACYLK